MVWYGKVNIYDKGRANLENENNMIQSISEATFEFF